MKTKTINIIYGLRDPRNNVYQYIGKSTVGVNRPLQHLKKSHSSMVNEWVEELRNNYQSPVIDIIEEVPDINKLSEREKFWINHYYEINPNLLNVFLVEKGITLNVRNEKDEEAFNDLIRIIHHMPKILKNERQYRKLTQDEMSKHMGVSRSTISLCERGGNVNFDTIKTYIRTLKGIDLITNVTCDRVHK